MKIGSLVECVIAHNMTFPEHIDALEKGTVFPEKDKIYTIRGLNDNEGIYLEEIINQKILVRNGTYAEVGFHHAYFKEIEFSEKEISGIL